MAVFQTLPQRTVDVLVRYPLLPLLIILVGVFAFATDGAQLLWPNLRGVLMDAAIVAIVAVPGAMLIIAGYIDLSVGSTLALGGVSAGMVVQATQSPALGVAVGVAAGALVGLINGIISPVWGLSAFITTLATLTIVRGVTQLISPLPANDFGDEFALLGVGTLLGVPLAVWMAAAVCAVGAAFLGLVPAGRYVYAIGINPHAAYLSGVRVRILPALLYVASGAAAGLAGVVTAARLNSAPPGQLGVGFEMAVLTAILLGGVSLKGGEGTILGVVIGVIFLGLLRNGLVLLGVQTFWQNVASGIALIGAIALAGNISRVRALARRKAIPSPQAPAPAAAAKS